MTRAYLDENPQVIEGFRPRARAGDRVRHGPHQHRGGCSTTAAAGNPQEGEDRAFATALLEAVRERQTPVDGERPWGYQPPEDWQAWHESQVATGGLSEPLPDLEAAYTNECVDAWNEGL